MHFFRLICDAPRNSEYKVYNKLWELRKCPEEDNEFGRHAFNGTDGLFSSALEKAQAIDMALIGVEQPELGMRENQVHRCLYELHRQVRPGVRLEDPEYGRHAFDCTYGKHASIEDKITAARMYASDSRAFTWLNHNNVVHLIKREDGELEAFAVDSRSGTSRAILLDREGVEREHSIQVLKGYAVTVDGDAIIPSQLRVLNNFEQSFPVRADINVRFRVQGNVVVAQAFNHVKKELSLVYIGDSDAQTILSLSCISPEECESALRDFDINAVIDHSSGTLTSIHLTKISFSSLMDSTKTVDRDNWAVTLISCGYSCAIKHVPLDPGFGHAEIIYEGVKNGARFIKYAHLTDSVDPKITLPTGHARVFVKDYNIEFNKEINARTPTWVRPSFLVKRIEAENGKNYLFNHTGNPVFTSTFSENIVRETTHIIGNSLLQTLVAPRQEESGPIATFASAFVEAAAPDNIPLFAKQVGKIFLSAIVNNVVEEVREPQYWTYEYNCLTWTIAGLHMAEISVPVPNTLIASPTAYIKSIVTDPSLVKN